MKPIVSIFPYTGLLAQSMSGLPVYVFLFFYSRVDRKDHRVHAHEGVYPSITFTIIWSPADGPISSQIEICRYCLFLNHKLGINPYTSYRSATVTRTLMIIIM